MSRHRSQGGAIARRRVSTRPGRQLGVPLVDRGEHESGSWPSRFPLSRVVRRCLRRKRSRRRIAARRRHEADRVRRRHRALGGARLHQRSRTDRDRSRSTGTDAEASIAEGTQIRITIGDAFLDGRLWDNPTARDLIAQLPLTLEFRDLNGVEKIARLPRELTMDGVPDGDDPEPQDIGYYAPAGDLVFYYDDVGYWEGIVRIGVFDRDMDAIRNQTGNFTATVELAT
jgi:hypothetical protein